MIVKISNESSLAGLLNINDIIIEVQKTPITKSADLNSVVNQIFKKGKKTLLITVINKDNQRRYLGVKLKLKLFSSLNLTHSSYFSKRSCRYSYQWLIQRRDLVVANLHFS